MKRRKEIAIVENDTQYQEIDTTKLFTDGDSNEFDAAVIDLMEKNRIQAEEIKNLKLEKESQAILVCEVVEQKKKPWKTKPWLKKKKES